MAYRLAELDTIIFDLGEVIVDLDPQAVIREFSRITDGKGSDLRELIVGSPYLYRYETGQVTDQEFVHEINQLFGTRISFEEFRHAWNLMIKAISPRRLELMQKLMATHRVLILSNTNAMHEVYFDEMVQSVTGTPMKAYAHTAYYSHLIGYRKPNEDIYEFVIKEQGLRPDRALFLDDKEENIQAARRVGLKAEQVKYPDQIFEILT